MTSPGRPVILIAVAVVTLLAMWWDRMVHDVANSPQPWESVLAGLVWCGSLAALVAVPVLLNLREKARPWSHSVVLDLTLGAAAGMYLLGVLGFDWPRWPELFNSDLEIVGATYLVSAVAFAFSLHEAIRAFRAGIRSRVVSGSGVALLCAAVVFVSSFFLVYFE